MNTADFPPLRRKLDDAITYANLDLARQLAREGLGGAQAKELLGEIMYFKAQLAIIDEHYQEAISFLNRAECLAAKTNAVVINRHVIIGKFLTGKNVAVLKISF